MELICPKCSSPQREGAKFCRRCGEKLAVTIEKCFCDMCGAELPAGSAFCDGCGASLGETASVTPDAEAASDGWGDALGDLRAFEEEERLAAFEYERRPDGSVVITGLKDKYALTVTVPEGVTVIEKSAFEGAELLEASLPESLTRIEARAFAGCPNLTRLILPASLLKIGDEAFLDCASLEIEIPDTVRILGENILSGTKTERLKEEAEAEAKRLEEERIAREKAEAEARLKEEQEKAQREKEQKWRDSLPRAATDELDSPQLYGFDSPEAFAWLKALANEGSICASIVLAKCYFHGCMVERSISTSHNILLDLFPKDDPTARALYYKVDSIEIEERRLRRRLGLN